MAEKKSLSVLKQMVRWYFLGGVKQLNLSGIDSFQRVKCLFGPENGVFFAVLMGF